MPSRGSFTSSSEDDLNDLTDLPDVNIRIKTGNSSLIFHDFKKGPEPCQYATLPRVRVKG